LPNQIQFVTFFTRAVLAPWTVVSRLVLTVGFGDGGWYGS
jgi:hypothetical protein